MYKVVRYFTDLQDNDHEYFAGDEYPRNGLEVTPERIAELASADNKQGVVLIEEVEAEPKAEQKPKKPRKKKETE